MTEKVQSYRQKAPKTVAASTHLQVDCMDAVKRYAASFRPRLSISGSIHRLLRSHPLIDLEDLDERGS